MLDEIDINSLVEPAIAWFRENKRDLPWRADRDPYHVWVSEIMLQQTRVEAVKPYYERWMRELPTVEILANCDDDRLMKLWEGLGYYSRVRNLKKAAQTIACEYGGRMPKDYEKIRALSGIGDYTAGAISSIAFDLPYPAVDGNVLRVMARVSDDDRDILLSQTKKDVTAALSEMMQNQMAKKGSGEWNQALMEIGALICVPNGEPKCAGCPWQDCCLSKQRGTSEKLPVRIKKTKRRKEDRTVLLIRDGENVLIRKRPNKGLLAGLYELPNVDGHLTENETVDYVRSLGLDPLRVEPLADAKHLFSHIEWDMTGYLVRVAGFSEAENLGCDAGAEDAPEDAETATVGNAFLVEVETLRRDIAIPSAFSAYAKYIS